MTRGEIIIEGYRQRDTFTIYSDGDVRIMHEWLPPGAGMWHREDVHLYQDQAQDLTELLLHVRDQAPGEGHAWQEPEVEE